jgi:hypothetical protein
MLTNKKIKWWDRFTMAKWKVLEKSKQKTQMPEKIEEKKPLAEYKETLHAVPPGSKYSTKPVNDQRIWRDVKAIEQNIDHIHTSSTPVAELDRTVDRLIAKIKR